MANVFKKYIEGLEELDTHVTSRLLTEDVQEEGKHVLLQEETGHRHKTQASKKFFLIQVD